jgi:hypothetical protein
VEFVVDKMVLGQAFLPALRFSCQYHYTVAVHSCVSPGGRTVGPLVGCCSETYSHPINMDDNMNNILLHVRFPWQRDIGALSRNNGMVQHCCVSLATQQYWTVLVPLLCNNVNKQ